MQLRSVGDQVIVSGNNEEEEKEICSSKAKKSNKITSTHKSLAVSYGTGKV